jgi:3-hydroxy acid dehydrogenase/malonic semialdehyde reductase
MSDELVVITGASSGIGEACARAFAKLGRPLFLGARRADRLAAVAQECEKLGAPKATAHPLDVTDKASIQAFCAAAGTPAILINNAGAAFGRDPIDKLRDEDLTGMLDLNVTGLVRVTRSLLPGMMGAKRGHIINLGSYAAHGVYEGGLIYCAAKHAVRAITQIMRLELSGTNIRISEIDPGLVETEFSVVRLGDESKAKKVYEGFQPLVAADVADAIAWVATRPAHVNISEIVMTPVAQASLTKVHRG